MHALLSTMSENEVNLVCAVNNIERTPLLHAVRAEIPFAARTSIVKALLRVRADPNHPWSRDKFSFHDVEIARLLVEAGLDVNSECLHTAPLPVAQYLLEAKADLNVSDRPIVKSFVNADTAAFTRSEWRSRIDAALGCIAFLGQNTLSLIASFIILSRAEQDEENATNDRAWQVRLCCYFICVSTLTDVSYSFVRP